MGNPALETPEFFRKFRLRRSGQDGYRLPLPAIFRMRIKIMSGRKDILPESNRVMLAAARGVIDAG
jgi:hypothetical protein